MAAGPAQFPQTSTITIPVAGDAGVGTVATIPPTFLEKWGVAFVSVAGLWILTVALVLMRHYLVHLPAVPVQAQGVSADDYSKILTLNKTAADAYRDSLLFVFDLLITKTVLPIVTLLLGYLFGSKKT